MFIFIRRKACLNFIYFFNYYNMYVNEHTEKMSWAIPKNLIPVRKTGLRLMAPLDQVEFKQKV